MRLLERLGFALIVAGIVGVWLDQRLGSLYAVGVVVVIIARVAQHWRVRHG